MRDETTAWAGQFDEQFTDVLNLEDVISSHVAEAIVPHLTVDQRLRLAKRGTDNPQAHEAYLRGRFYWNTFTEDGFARAIVCYQQAIARSEIRVGTRGRGQLSQLARRLQRDAVCRVFRGSL